MPNISETSVSDMSLSPAWRVMIIFFLVDSWFRDRPFGPSSQRGELSEGAGAFAQATRPDRSNSHRVATVKGPKSRNDSGRSTTNKS